MTQSQSAVIKFSSLFFLPLECLVLYICSLFFLPLFTNHLRKLKLFTRTTPDKSKVLKIFFLESIKNLDKICLHLVVLNHGCYE